MEQHRQLQYYKYIDKQFIFMHPFFGKWMHFLEGIQSRDNRVIVSMYDGFDRLIAVFKIA